jgi:cobalt/nickel transport system permease protein
MSHMHIPDGVLPIWLVLLGWALAALLLLIVSRRLRGGDRGRQLPLLGVMSAFMLVGMSTEIVPIAYHMNLSVLAGIVLGPALGFLAALIVNLILALFGHGGITVAGLNSLVIGSEVVIGYYLFRALWAFLKGRGRSPVAAAVAATALALVISTTLMIGIVGLSNLDSSSQAGRSAEELSFRNPLEHGLIASEFGAAEHEAQATPSGGVDLASFARLVYLLGLLGWVLESAITGAIVGFVYRVRPDLVTGERVSNSRLRPSAGLD